MSFYVYIISSEKIGRFYIGQTRDISTRFFQHNQGLSNYTVCGIPWKLECVIEKSTLKEALLLERKLKNLSKRRKIKFIKKYRGHFNRL